MEPGFEKLCTFDIDCDQLYRDWHESSSVILKIKNPYARTLVNQSVLSNGNDPLFLNVESKYPLETFNASTIRNEFKGTYTEQVVSLLEQWFNARNLRATRIKYALLKPAVRTGPAHVDTAYDWRYHLAVKTNPTVFMSVDDVKYPMTEAGTLYRMHAKVLHWPGNLGPEDRLFLTFDVTTL